MNGYRAGIFGEQDLGYAGLESQPALMYSLNGGHSGQSRGFPYDPNRTYDFSDSGVKTYSISFILQDNEQTLTDKPIDKIMDKLMGSFEKELGAVIRK